MDTDDSGIGRRFAEQRAVRGLSIRAAAGLAGFSPAYISRIENGAPVNLRSTLEALAFAVKVSPNYLAGSSHPPLDPVSPAERAAMAELELVMSAGPFGDRDTPARRPWGQVRADVVRLNATLRPDADYAEQSRLLPGLLADLHAAYWYESRDRRDVLVALLDVHHAIEELAKTLGAAGTPVLAAVHAQIVAEELDEPAFLGLASWVRGMAVPRTPPGRDRMLDITQRAADSLRPALDDPAAAQAFGALSLSAALAAAVKHNRDAVQDHLAEASRVAEMTAGARPFGALYFGETNVAITRMSLLVEHDEPAKVREVARTVDLSTMPSVSRRAMYWGDLGRGLASRRGSEEAAVSALRSAEDIAPSMVRNNRLMRASVVSMLPRVRRDSTVDRDLRGLAYRMGISA